MFGSLGWTSNTYLGGIEDRYMITLQPAVVARLKPTFAANSVASQMQRVAPNDVYSVTSYKFANPAAAWLSLKSAVSSQVDVLSAVVIASLLRSALLSYGIDDPESFLGAIDGELFTLRLDENGERSLLIGGVRDRAMLRHVVTKTMSLKTRDFGSASREIFEDSQGEIGAALTDEFIVVGSPLEVRRYFESGPMRPENLKRITSFVSSPASASVITYTNDGDRVRSFITAVFEARNKPTVGSQPLEETIAALPYSVTETTLGDIGIERTTRSPLGQFSSLLPLLFPKQPSPLKNANQSR
jgi:hypothetical protein